MTDLNSKSAVFSEHLLIVGSVWFNKGSLKLTSHGVLHYF